MTSALPPVFTIITIFTSLSVKSTPQQIMLQLQTLDPSPIYNIYTNSHFYLLHGTRNFLHRHMCKQKPLLDVVFFGFNYLGCLSSALFSSAFVGLCLNNPTETINCMEILLIAGPPLKIADQGSLREDGGACLPGCAFGWIGLVAPPAQSCTLPRRKSPWRSKSIY